MAQAIPALLLPGNLLIPAINPDPQLPMDTPFMLKVLNNIVVASLLIAQPAFSGYPPDSSEPYRYLIQQTGIERQLPSLTEMAKQTAHRHSRRCNSQHTAQIDSDANWAAFDAHKLTAHMRELLKQRIGKSQLTPVLNWYASSPGQRISQLEAQPTSEDDIVSFAATLASDSNWQNVRQNLVQQINKNTRADEFGAVIGIEIEYAGLMNSACIEQAADQSDGVNREQLRADLTRKDRHVLMQIFHNDTNVGIAYQLRSLTNQQLKEYANFTSTDQAKRFFTALIQTLDQTLRTASNSLID